MEVGLREANQASISARVAGEMPDELRTSMTMSETKTSTIHLLMWVEPVGVSRMPLPWTCILC